MGQSCISPVTVDAQPAAVGPLDDDRGAPGGPRMLVTGASGLLGATFCRIANGRFRVSGCFRQHGLHLRGIESFPVDLRVKAEAVQALERVQPETIVHFAAATDVNHCEEHPREAEEINVQVTENLAQWAARQGVRFLLMSTDSVFDGRRGCYTELDEPNPINRYATTKLQAEGIVRGMVADHLIVRSNIYGWNAQAKSSLAEWILQRLETGVRIPGFADVIFAPLLVDTLAEIMLTLLGQGKRGTYHAASDGALSKYDFALAIADTFHLSRELVDRVALASVPMRAPRPLNTSLDCSKLQLETGVAPPTVQEDLQRYKRLRDEGFAGRLKAACS